MAYVEELLNFECCTTTKTLGNGFAPARVKLEGGSKVVTSGGAGSQTTLVVQSNNLTQGKSQINRHHVKLRNKFTYCTNFHIFQLQLTCINLTKSMKFKTLRLVWFYT